ncbi:MATE family efflux transporter [Paenibacillus macquariensis]|uniref:Efflux protein, MATE family n=1 Tax=Paenibacillus macquariensis TaxID=948756 RepID=A0ABY1JY36_9BACL|nr:MATE family efflux transporter [Paenibacillus macquariensis]MEC0089184.1 MATE family efflux transporter [Paenibacillus macquariensis]OAB33396.1 MATE family efflux transporter [Paenibacillus macquariensis subsp. macquariensis]SIQ96922.1 putative efflux protein, MATE family [Paenibacillus macquariensis]
MNQKKHQEFNLIKLTWPIFLELFLFMLMGSVDTFMISSVSDNAVSGVGAANQIIAIAILVLSVIGNGAAIVISQFLGSRKLLEAAQVTGNSITLNLLIGFILSAFLLLFGGSLLSALNVQGDIYLYAQSYLNIVGGFIFLQALINALAATIRTHGFTKQTMIVSLLMNLIHVVGNYALIFGHFGFPALGVQGAAISTVLSRLICLILFFLLLNKIMDVRVKWSYYIHLSKQHVQKILKIGIPSGFEQITYQSCQLVFTLYVTYLGAEAMATRQYAVNISSYIYLFSLAVSMGTSIIVGHLVGAKRTDEAYRRVFTSVKWALLVTVIIDGIIIFFRVPLFGLFTNNESIIMMGAQVILLSIFLETGRTTNLVIINSLRASGDAKFPVYMGLISMVCMSLPLGYVLVFQLHLGLAGVWIAIACDEWLRAIIMFFRWKSRAWEKHGLIQHETVESDANNVATVN